MKTFETLKRYLSQNDWAGAIDYLIGEEKKCPKDLDVSLNLIYCFGLDGATGNLSFTTGHLDFGARHYDPYTCRWNTIDPMAGKYHSFSPYNYCAGTPINLTDPDGRGPIYAKTIWGGVKKIGDDGNRNTCSYLVRGSIAREVKRASKVGSFYTGDLSENSNVMHIPTGQLLEGVKQSYEDTKESNRENGGHYNKGDTVVTRWDEGPAATSFVDKDGNKVVKATLKMFMINGINSMPSDASNVKMWWHTHPNTTVGGISLGSSTPSDADYKGQGTLLNRGYKGNTFVIGVRSGTVSFYNESRVLITIKWNDFIKMGDQNQ